MENQIPAQKRKTRLITEAQFHNWETDGAIFEGYILNGGTARVFNTEQPLANQYKVVDCVTEDGEPRIIVAGTVLQKALIGASDTDLFKITYEGEKRTKENKPVKIFKVEVYE